jgi:DNA-binding NtrC family response regulator
MSETAAAKEQPKLRDRLESICVEMIERGILFPEAREQFEKSFITEVVRRHNGNLARAAQRLKIHRNTLTTRIRRYQAVRSSQRRFAEKSS